MQHGKILQFIPALRKIRQILRQHHPCQERRRCRGRGGKILGTSDREWGERSTSFSAYVTWGKEPVLLCGQYAECVPGAFWTVVQGMVHWLPYPYEITRRKNSHYLKITDENYGRVRLAEYRKSCTEDPISKQTCIANPTTENTRWQTLLRTQTYQNAFFCDILFVDYLDAQWLQTVVSRPCYTARPKVPWLTIQIFHCI